MSSLSDRQHDVFDNPAKAACREGNPRVLREAAYLRRKDGDRTPLRCDWCAQEGLLPRFRFYASALCSKTPRVSALRGLS